MAIDGSLAYIIPALKKNALKDQILTQIFSPTEWQNNRSLSDLPLNDFDFR